jgi:glycosyltransferase involved in cell wall biosynthesis
MEPWGLVANEAAACGLPLLISERAGCVETLVPDPAGTTGRRFDPADEVGMAGALSWLAAMPEPDRAAMGPARGPGGRRLGAGPLRPGMLEALDLALDREASRDREPVLAASAMEPRS